MIIQHFTDNDLYKFSTMYAILRAYPNAYVRYEFIDRSNIVFPEGFATYLRNEVQAMAFLKLTPEEKRFFMRKCDFLDHAFLDFLEGYVYDPNEVSIEQNGGSLRVTIEGYWYRTVLWETPILALISEIYYKMMALKPTEVKGRTLEKAFGLRQVNAEYADYGTRRRFSFDVHDEVIGYLKLYSKQYFKGSSNVYLSMKHDVTPAGTMPHEWFMFHGAVHGYRTANMKALESWISIYHGKLGIALTDTYTTDVFYDSFTLKHAKLYDGVRWDSGDPFEFTDKTIAFYKNLQIDPKSKIIVYSDMLNANRVHEIKNYVNGRIRDVYGIGTYFSNDVGHKPLNIVIKLTAVKYDITHPYLPAAKLSDSPGKQTGNPEEIELIQRMLGMK